MTPEEIDAVINQYRPEDRPKIRAAFEERRAGTLRMSRRRSSRRR